MVSIEIMLKLVESKSHLTSIQILSGDLCITSATPPSDSAFTSYPSFGGYSTMPATILRRAIAPSNYVNMVCTTHLHCTNRRRRRNCQSRSPRLISFHYNNRRMILKTDLMTVALCQMDLSSWALR